MSILGRALLPLLALLACQGDVVTPRAQPLRTHMLKESIRLLQHLLRTQVSCNEMNVTNIFADNKPGASAEILCQAATVALQGQSCHRPLQDISDNLLGLLRGNRTEHTKPCPVAEGSTTSLKNFLKELQQVLQKVFKSWK